MKIKFGRFLGIILLFLSFEEIVAQEEDVPRPEYPRPQFVREKWINLNGEWDFKIDNSKTGIEKGWNKNTSSFSESIKVPFAPESKLSGIENNDFMNEVWYHRNFSVPKDWESERIFVNFGAVDYKCTVFVNGSRVGVHYGGNISFSFEVTKFLKKEENSIIVMAEDDIRSGVQPAGKQSMIFKNRGVSYTRTTGIWQTVWLEARPSSYLKSVKVLPDVDNSSFVITPEIENFQNGQEFKVTLLKDGKVLSTATNKTLGVPVFLEVKKPRLWSPNDPFLYDLRFELLDKNKKIDEVKSYAGLRKIHISDGKIYLNNKPIFLRFVLDQGFYPDGIWTAPSDSELKHDIELAMKVGFNGARLHQKVFDPRFHYWADKLGYLTMGEMADWPIVRSYANPEGWINITREWREVIQRDYNHPSIIIWTPLNETYSARENYEGTKRADEDIYNLTRALDPSRPVNNSSGFLHFFTDIWSVHSYEQDYRKFAEQFNNIEKGNDKTQMFMNGWDWYGEVSDYNITYKGQPYIVDEYGGIYWQNYFANEKTQNTMRKGKWGYGKTRSEIVKHIAALTKILTENPDIAGFTYTQLTDVFQEINGIYTFDRQLKFPLDELRKAFTQPAAMEDDNKSESE